VLLDLAAEDRGLLHQIAAMTHQQLELPPELVERRLDQGKAVDGGAADGG
jgi:hypothetical protein